MLRKQTAMTPEQSFVSFVPLCEIESCFLTKAQRTQRMDTMQKYPIRFYGRALLFLVGILASAPIAIVGCLMVPISLLVLVWEPTIASIGYVAMIIFYLLFMLLFVACIFQVYVRQRPILKLCKEGLWIRSLGTPISINPFLNTLFGFIPIIIAVLWQVVTLRIFRIQMIRLQWENVDVMSGEDNLTITGWFDKDNLDDFGRNDLLENYSISYGVYSFREPFDKVIESVQFFLHNPDSREMLPSWQDDDIVSDRFAVYND